MIDVEVEVFRCTYYGAEGPKSIVEVQAELGRIKGTMD